MPKLQIGAAAPAFRLPSTSGETVALASLRGQKVVLYFYPKDDTPGCTREACDFKDNLARLKKENVVVLGVSKDSLAAHAKFRAKYALPFDLLVDDDVSVARAYGAYGKKKLYGREFEGIIRSTFLIDEQGKLAAVWSPVNVDGHVDKVLAALTGETAPKTKVAAPKRAAKAPADRAAKPRTRTTRK